MTEADYLALLKPCEECKCPIQLPDPLGPLEFFTVDGIRYVTPHKADCPALHDRPWEQLM